MLPENVCTTHKPNIAVMRSGPLYLYP